MNICYFYNQNIEVEKYKRNKKIGAQNTWGYYKAAPRHSEIRPGFQAQGLQLKESVSVIPEDP